MEKEELPALWEHQRAAVLRARHFNNFALFCDPGTGKTRATIEILKEKYTSGLLNTLILTPKVVIEQWKREFERYSDINPNYIFLMTGTGSKKSNVLKDIISHRERGSIVITNYETLLNKTIFAFLENWIKVLVCDESSRLKNISAQRTKLAIKLGDNSIYRYILSGTPILGSQLDIFSQFRVLDKGKTFGKNYHAFRAFYFYDKNAAWKGSHNYFPDWQPKTNCNTSISEKIAPLSIRVKKEDAIDLPELVKEEIFVEFSIAQRKHYEEMKNNLITYLNDKACVAKMALTKTLRLQQMVSGFIGLEDGTEKSFKDFSKLTALKDLLEDIAPHHKVIVWCIYKKNYEDIKNICAELGLGVSELHGGISDKDAEVRRFQSDSACNVMVSNPNSGGIGISLTQASYSIFYSRGFSLEADIQAEARNYRGGSIDLHKKVTRIDLLVKNSIDELILFAIKQKLATSDDILNLLREKIK